MRLKHSSTAGMCSKLRWWVPLLGGLAALIVVALPVWGVGSAPTTEVGNPAEAPPVAVPVILDGVRYEPEEFNMLQKERYPEPVYLISCGSPDGESLLAFTTEEKWDEYARAHGLPMSSEWKEGAVTGLGIRADE